jgi:hypothetical protein
MVLMLCLLQMLRVVPDASWLAAFDAASMACMAAFTPQGLGDILAAQVRAPKEVMHGACSVLVCREI